MDPMGKLLTARQPAQALLHVVSVVVQLSDLISLGLKIAQSRYYLQTLDPKVAIRPLGAPGYLFCCAPGSYVGFFVLWQSFAGVDVETIEATISSDLESTG